MTRLDGNYVNWNDIPVLPASQANAFNLVQDEIGFFALGATEEHHLQQWHNVTQFSERAGTTIRIIIVC
jgi:hypothetical protein